MKKHHKAVGDHMRHKHEDHMTVEGPKGSTTLMGMKQTSYDTKIKGGDLGNSHRDVENLADVTDGNPNS